MFFWKEKKNEVCNILSLLTEGRIVDIDTINLSVSSWKFNQPKLVLDDVIEK